MQPGRKLTGMRSRPQPSRSHGAAMQPMPDNELRDLVETLHATHERILELTGGAIDAVHHASGATYMLREAQHDLQREQSAQQAFAAERGAILDALPAAIALLDADAHMVTANQGWRTHERAFAGHGARPGDDYPAECARTPGLDGDVAQRLTHKIRAVLDGEATAESLDYTLEDGHFRVSLAPARVDGARAAVLMHADITEQRRLEVERLRGQRLEALGQLTGGVAHDFNNLLTVICGNADLIAGADTVTGPTAQLAAGIREAGERATRLTRQLLAFARQQPLAPETVDLAAHLRAQQELLDRSLSDAVELALRLPDTPCHAQVDIAQLDAALLNLSVNARDAMPDGGTVSIELTTGTGENAGMVALHVRDSGCGMTEPVCARAFDPFFTTKPRGSGTGLGLSMVHGFVRQSGGRVALDSTPGQGTCISLYLPLATTGPSEAAAPEAASTADPPPGIRILAVEDDPLVREHVTLLLEQLGYTVNSAANAAEALRRLEADPGVDLVFSDVIMPGGQSGRALAQTVRRRWPGIRILLASGYLEDDGPAGDPEAPREHFIMKPYRRAALAQKLAEVLSGSAGAH